MSSEGNTSRFSESELARTLMNLANKIVSLVPQKVFNIHDSRFKDMSQEELAAHISEYPADIIPHIIAYATKTPVRRRAVYDLAAEILSNGAMKSNPQSEFTQPTVLAGPGDPLY